MQESQVPEAETETWKQEEEEAEKQKSKDSESIAKLQSEIQILRQQISRAEDDRKNAVNQMKMETESEAAEKMADGQATKIVVPSNLQDVTGLVTAVSETLKK